MVAGGMVGDIITRNGIDEVCTGSLLFKKLTANEKIPLLFYLISFNLCINNS